MKKLVATFCLLGLTLALSACSSTTDSSDGMSPAHKVAPADKVFSRSQAK